MQLIGSEADEERISGIFSALADPTRRAILRRLSERDASVAELAGPFAISQPAVSKHLKVLEAAGLISRRQVATSRLSHLETDALQEAAAWMDWWKRFWGDRFDRLDGALASYLERQPDTEDREDERR